MVDARVTRRDLSVLQSTDGASNARSRIVTRHDLSILQSTGGASESRVVRDTRHALEVLCQEDTPIEPNKIRDTRNVLEVLCSTQSWSSVIEKVDEVDLLTKITEIADAPKLSIASISDRKVME